MYIKEGKVKKSSRQNPGGGSRPSKQSWTLNCYPANGEAEGERKDEKTGEEGDSGRKDK